MQVCTGTLVVTASRQVVFTQLLPEPASAAVHEATPWSVVVYVKQVVCVKLLSEVGSTAPQVCTPIGPVVLDDGHEVVIQFGADAADSVHEATGTFVVLFGVQVIAIQLLSEEAVWLAQV